RSLGAGKVVGICPAGSWAAKTWDVEKFASVGDMITERMGHSVVIIWGPGEKPLAERMCALMRTKAEIACRTSLPEAAALMRRCSVFVSNDSGLKHVAVAVGTPTVTIYGPTNPRTWNPPLEKHRAVSAEVECLFCDKNTCDSMACMRELAPEKVFDQVRRLLAWEETGKN
ncbi:MAG: glycosyltransferase family 9 protein, partial [Candidatus Eisenbacteria bacterium]